MTLKKTIIFLFKILVTFLLITFLFQKMDYIFLWEKMKIISLPYMGGAFFFLFLSHYISSLRLRYYFIHMGYECKKLLAIALYFMGVFYNLLLPGGIGGDGYIIWKSRRILLCSAKHAFYVIINSRANGLFLLILLSILLSFFSPSLHTHSFFKIFLATALFSGCVYVTGLHFIFKEYFASIFKASVYSFWIQISALFCVFLLIKGLHFTSSSPEMLFLFLVSSVAAVFPISVGGIGLRECTFFYGCPLLGVNSQEGITLALVYFFINTSITFLGSIAYFILKKYDSTQ